MLQPSYSVHSSPPAFTWYSLVGRPSIAYFPSAFVLQHCPMTSPLSDCAHTSTPAIVGPPSAARVTVPSILPPGDRFSLASMDSPSASASRECSSAMLYVGCFL